MKMTVKGLKQGYGNNIVLDDISFEAESGEFVTILGPNGCGKSTLIKSLCNVRKPKSGDIFIDDRSVKDYDTKELSRTISYVPQNFVQSSYTTVYDAVLIGRRPYVEWSYSEEDVRICANAIMEMKVDQYLDRFVNELSGGQTQRVVIARALAQDPEFYIFDEPTSSFDLKNQLDLMRIMKRIIKDKNACLIVALHDLNLAMRYSDKVIVLDDGGIYDMGPPDKVINSEMIKKVYGVDAHIVNDDNGTYIHTYDREGDEFSDRS